jgi:small subunit ribosomal protein S6
MAMNQENKSYQITLFLPPILNQEKVNEVIEKIKQMIIKQGGSLTEENLSANLKRLAYPIKKHQEAFYLSFNFSLPNQAIESLNQQLNLENNIIRYLITLKEKLKTKPDKEVKEVIDYDKIVEKIEPLPEEKPSTSPEPSLTKKESIPESTETSTTEKKEKAKIEELDKKLEEILNT